ncbi:MAG: ATP-binding protein [Novosphingobium sp.]|nr:ATP-binding protein [Novosphingobium sp.]
MPVPPALARARSDGADALVSADALLAELQRHCGGDLPGRIAIPALLDVVRKVRGSGLNLSRNIFAQDGAQRIRAWVEVMPREDGEPGCDIALKDWQAQVLPADDQNAAEARRAGIDRELAELTAQLDAAQCVLAAEAEAPDLQALAERMRAGAGQPWTAFVQLDDSGHAQPLHWRLLDGARLHAEGSSRGWRACLTPRARPGEEPHGFELSLVSDEALPEPAGPVDGDERAGEVAPMQFATIGRDVAPVLRQPIASIIANAETIRTRLAGPLDDQYAGYAAEIVSAGQHLLSLLADLSDMEIVEADDFSTAPDRIDLGDVARQACGILGVRARERGITLEASPPGEGVQAIAEFRRTLQILLNLIGNAIRYSPDGSRIVVALEDRGQTATVTVTDEGPGLSPEEQQRVFEKFERLGRSGDGGTGLGLYISRRLARAMGGELSVKSELGEGARFIVELPGVV